MSDPDQVWEVQLARQPQRILRRLPRDLRHRLDQAIRALPNDPRPSGCKKLAGYDNLYRLRVGDWRISYAIEEDRLVILVLEVAPRGDAYREL